MIWGGGQGNVLHRQVFRCQEQGGGFIGVYFPRV